MYNLICLTTIFVVVERMENCTTWIKVLIGYGTGAVDQIRHLLSNNYITFFLLNITLRCTTPMFVIIIYLIISFCRNWKFIHPKKKTFSMRNAKVGKDSLFSKEVLYTLFLTNFLSILLGAGVGYEYRNTHITQN